MVYFDFKQTFKQLLKLKAKHNTKKQKLDVFRKNCNPQRNHNPTLTQALTLTLAANYPNPNPNPELGLGLGLRMELITPVKMMQLVKMVQPAKTR